LIGRSTEFKSSMFVRVGRILGPETPWNRFNSWRYLATWRVSSHGRVCDTKGHITWGTPIASGYRTCHISGKTYSVHRLVALHFLETPSASHMHVIHMDGDRANNHVTNLQYVSVSSSQALAAACRVNPGRKPRAVQLRMEGTREWTLYPSVQEAAQAARTSSAHLRSVLSGRSSCSSVNGFECRLEAVPDLPAEEWAPLVHPRTGLIVPHYTVSNHGRYTGPQTDKSRGMLLATGYLRASVQGEGLLIHRLVLCSFLGFPEGEHGGPTKLTSIWEVNHFGWSQDQQLPAELAMGDEARESAACMEATSITCVCSCKESCRRATVG